MFNQSGGLRTGTSCTSNPMQDFEVVSPPDDSTSSLAFSPASVPQNFLVAGSWDCNVRCWEVEQSGKTVPKSMQVMGAPVLDVCWSDDGTKVFIASCDKTVKCWDLASNQSIQVAAHDAPVRTCHWIKASTYSCLMTGSWDKTLRFWDLRSPKPAMTLNLIERCYCADVVSIVVPREEGTASLHPHSCCGPLIGCHLSSSPFSTNTLQVTVSGQQQEWGCKQTVASSRGRMDYPMAVVGTAGRGVIVYQLEGSPREYKTVELNLKYQYRCVAIFRDKKKVPAGFAIGSTEGRVAIHYLNLSAKENFTFKCHRVNGTPNGYQDIYPVNDVAFHPVHGTVATVGSDGTFGFWDKDSRTKLKSSDPMEQPIARCCFNHNGQIFAYAVSYDWSKDPDWFGHVSTREIKNLLTKYVKGYPSTWLLIIKGHEYYNPAKKNSIFLRPCFEELKPKVTP